jgi:hypothetical protein
VPTLRSLLVWGIGMALVGCRAKARSSIELTAGPDEHLSFVPKAAFFEYVELPGERNELKITLASYAAACGRYVPPPAGQALVSVTVVTPQNVKPTATTYVWAGHEAHGGSVTRPARPYALPTARIGRHGYLIPPGGSIRLTHVSLSAQGQVDGLLSFEFAGDATRPATAIKGRFSADICREAP